MLWIWISVARTGQKTHVAAKLTVDAGAEIYGLCAGAEWFERLHGGFFVQRSIMGKLARILRCQCSGD